MPNPLSLRGRPPHPDTLTPSEGVVLHLVRHGLDNRQIARARRTSVEAVKFHLRNITSKVGARGRTALQHWDGIPTLLRSAVKETTMTTDGLGIQNLGQVHVGIKDVDRAVAFYRDILGLKHLFTFGSLAFFDLEGVRLFLSTPESGEWQPSSVLYYRVPDIHAAHQALDSQGVTFESAPHLIHRHESGLEEWMAFFHDTEGNMLGLMSQIQPTA